MCSIETCLMYNLAQGITKRSVLYIIFCFRVSLSEIHVRNNQVPDTRAAVLQILKKQCWNAKIFFTDTCFSMNVCKSTEQKANFIQFWTFIQQFCKYFLINLQIPFANTISQHMKAVCKYWVQLEFQISVFRSFCIFTIGIKKRRSVNSPHLMTRPRTRWRPRDSASCRVVAKPNSSSHVTSSVPQNAALCRLQNVNIFLLNLRPFY